MKKVFMFVVPIIAIVVSSIAFADQWNGDSTISDMYVYPDYAVVIQGPSNAGPANCVNNTSWSFVWADFPDKAVQARILSMLLTAKATERPIAVVISSDRCGPEGLKNFNGQIKLK